eukprot:TRINITY_DN9487_c0_g1_i5.p1 TRINITY_DN9487_c0_g1~~TRINITY_DN9487_c0_g1_i5.p1  ORF type:complete len:941 (+),score=103.79 TRINITY_DN9487_c0_g1_i5:147-2969(+)
MGCHHSGSKLPKDDTTSPTPRHKGPVRNVLKSSRTSGTVSDKLPDHLPNSTVSSGISHLPSDTVEPNGDGLSEPLLEIHKEVSSLRLPRIRFNSTHSYDESNTCQKGKSPLTCHGNSMLFTAPWMNKLNDYLSYLHYGDSKFYGNHLKRLWPSVDLDNLHVEASALLRKHMKDVLAAVFMCFLGFVTFPFRLLVGVPFYCFVLHGTKETDIVAARTRRHLSFMREMTPLYIASLLCMWILFRVSNGTFTDDATEQHGVNYEKHLRSVFTFVSEGEMFSPFRGLLVVVVLEVIRKQRRDMTHLVNLIQHHLFVDQALRGDRTAVSFGPVAQTDRDHKSMGGHLWLLSSFPSDCRWRGTLLDAHRAHVEEQIVQLELGTGPITEIAQSEAAMFFRSSMRDMLKQRLATLDQTRLIMEEMIAAHVKHPVVSMNFNELVEVLCAGYYNHFAEETNIMWEYKPSWRIFLVSLIYALLPTIASAWNGTLSNRLPFTSASKQLPEVPIFVTLTSIACFLNVYAVMRSLHTLAEDLERARECFVILQLIASTHHLQRARFKEFQRLESTPKSPCGKCCNEALSFFPTESPCVSRLVREGGERTGVACNHEIPQRVRFKASIMRGSDCHVSVGHMHRFDNLMRKRYSVAPEIPLTTPASQHRVTSNAESALGDGHLHSFFELDIHSQPALRMWWVMRLFVESGLLKDKIVMELLVGFTVFILIALVIFSISWFLIVGQLNISHLMASWEFLVLGSGVLQIFRKCGRLNAILSADSKRLTFIQHDICEEVATCEAERRKHMAAACAPSSVASSESPVCSKFSVPCPSGETQPREAATERPLIAQGVLANGSGDVCQDVLQNAVNVTLVRDSGGLPVAEDPHFDARVTIQLLKILVDHLERDCRPLQFVGFKIDERFLRRLYTVIISFGSSIVIHLVAKTAVGVLGVGTTI